MPGTTLVWFRNDLRLQDNPALQAAAERGGSVVPVYIWASEDGKPWNIASASRWWLHHSLANLDGELRRHECRLILRQGEPLAEIKKLVKETDATAVHWNRVYEPASIARDKKIKELLREEGIEVHSFNGSLLHEPWQVQTGSKTPYKVFTPFSRACLARGEPDEPLKAPSQLRIPGRWPKSLEVSELKLLPRIPWDAEFGTAWEPGERAAHKSLDKFLAEHVGEYSEERDRPDHLGTSCLSPRLHFGELSPRQVWHAVLEKFVRKNDANGGEPFLRQLLWREFAYHLLYHFPNTPDEPLRAEFAHFPWQKNAKWLTAWQRGQTGYPYIDAGMRQLWTTGWMHNRVRMAVGSFLVKDLLLPWQLGAKWFWDTLVDADLANNTLGWQWVGGCGADAAPYFRIFNPISQAKKFDPEGAYVRRWVPELAELPNEWIHEPWLAPARVLAESGVSIGTSYPRPIVDHATARGVALAAFERMRKLGSGS